MSPQPARKTLVNEDALKQLTSTITHLGETNTRRFELLAEEVEAIKANREAAAAAAASAAVAAASAGSTERLSQVENLAKWANPWRQVLLLVGVLLGAILTAYTVTRDYAKETLIEIVTEAHKEDIEPSIKTVNSLKNNTKATDEGVKALIEDRKHHRRIEQIQFALTLHKHQYEEKIKAWETKRKRGPKPEKTPRHLELETTLNTLNVTRPPLPETTNK